MVALSVIALIVGAVLFDIILVRVFRALNAHRRQKLLQETGNTTVPLSTSRLDVTVAPGAFHHKGQTWLQWRMDGSMVVGMNDLLHRVIGRIDEIRLPETGGMVKRGDKAVMIRQGDRVLYLLSPATGIITKTNTAVIENPSLPKTDPYNAGWLYTMNPGDTEQDMGYLMIARRAEDWISREKERMRNHFIDLLHKGKGKTAGGEMPSSLNGIVEKMDEEMWVVFKDQFIYHREWRS